MKKLIEAQMLNWRQELDKQIKIRDQAQKVLAESNKTILLIEGGLQAKEQLLKKIEQESQQLNKEDLKKESKTAQSDS